MARILPNRLSPKLRKKFWDADAIKENRKLLSIMFAGLIGKTAWLDSDGILSLPFADVISIRVVGENLYTIEVYRPPNFMMRVFSGIFIIVLRALCMVTYLHFIRKLRKNYMKYLEKILKNFNCDISIESNNPHDYVLLEI